VRKRSAAHDTDHLGCANPVGSNLLAFCHDVELSKFRAPVEDVVIPSAAEREESPAGLARLARMRGIPRFARNDILSGVPGRIAATICIVSSTLLVSVPSKAWEAQRRGAFAFHYGPVLDERALGWYSRFDLLVTHDPLPPDQVKVLHAAGTKLVLYEWAVAFYETRATDWQRSLLEKGHAALLNAKPLYGGVGSTSAPAWYFDPADDAHATGRAADVKRRLADAGYDGIFLDTTTFDSVHPDARAEYARRHPTVPYDRAYSVFLRHLREQMPGMIIFTNQAYMKADDYLPYVDWDLTESLITRPLNGTFVVRPWNDPADPWNSTQFLMRTLIEPVATRYPRVRFGHLNYVSQADPEVIDLVEAISLLFGGEGYVAAPRTRDEESPVYFRDPGKAVASRMDSADGKTSSRTFEHFTVTVTATGNKPRAAFAKR
jgi:hypothetical protein